MGPGDTRSGTMEDDLWWPFFRLPGTEPTEPEGDAPPKERVGRCPLSSTGGSLEEPRDVRPGRSWKFARCGLTALLFARDGA